MVSATMGQALAHKRAELGLEKGQAAQRIGMSRTTYSSYEQDAQRPSVEVFPAIASFLGVSMEDVLALYGATCIVQARSFLARVKDDPLSGGGDVQLTQDVSASPTTDERQTNEVTPSNFKAVTSASASPDDSPEPVEHAEEVAESPTSVLQDGGNVTAFEVSTASERSNEPYPSSPPEIAPGPGPGPGPESKAKKKKKKKNKK